MIRNEMSLSRCDSMAAVEVQPTAHSDSGQILGFEAKRLNFSPCPRVSVLKKAKSLRSLLFQQLHDLFRRELLASQGWAVEVEARTRVVDHGAVAGHGEGRREIAGPS